MFIEKITVQYFKTFGVSTSIGPFFPGINILVGNNGSGKTSLFDAIELIFHSDYEKLDNNQLSKLICHETERRNKNVISVEIIFDNSDRTYSQLPLKFSIQRKVSHGFDNYFVNQQKMTRIKFMEFIEKFNIDILAFRQGEITQFATSSDQKRLNMLFKMIGYQKITTNSKARELMAAKLEATNKTMLEVNQCYDKLKEQHHLYEGFQKMLRKKKWIICGMEKKKLIDTKQRMQQLEEKFNRWFARQKDDKPKYFKLQSELDLLECTLTENKNLLQAHENTEKKIKTTIQELEVKKRQLDISVLGRVQNNKEQENILAKMNEELKRLEVNITSDESVIQSMKSEFLLISTHARELEEKYGDELWELECLRHKLSRDQKPVSREVRDQSIRESIKALEENLAKKQEHLGHYQSVREERNQKAMELFDKISSIQLEIKSLKISQQDYSQELGVLQRKLKITTDLSQAVTTQIEDVSEKLRLLQNDYKQLCTKLRSAVKYDVIYIKTTMESALQSFNDETSRDKIDASNYHGFVIDCFQCLPEVEAAILAVAGGRLFDFVFSYGKDCLRIFKTFTHEISLSAINLDLIKKYQTKSLPEDPHAYPLIRNITYKPVYESLMKFLFGSVMVCRDIQTAFSLCKRTKLTAVTLNGNVVFPDGNSEAGNWDANVRNQIQLYRLMSRRLEEIKNEEKVLDSRREQKLLFIENISKMVEHKNMLILQMSCGDERRVSLEGELGMLEAEFRCTAQVKEQNEMESGIKKLTERIAELQLKLNSDGQEEVTSEECQRYDELKASTEALFRLWKEAEKSGDELDKKITIKLDVLRETYLRVKSDLQKKIHEIVVAKEVEVELMKSEVIELEFIGQMLEKESKKLEEVQNEVEKIDAVIKEIADTRELKENEAFKQKIDVDINDIDLKHLEDERDELSKIIESASDGVDQLADLSCGESDPELRNIEELTVQQLASLQRTVDEQLRQISHNIDVNASEKFARMRGAVEEVKNDMKCLDDDTKCVDRLKENYKVAVQQQIYDDLGKINRYFKDIVGKFMPDSCAELVLITASQEWTVDRAKNAVDLDDVIGVSMKFTEFKNHSAQTINELSGGQKTILALAFVIAVRKCCLLSVILCDEIDQALDSCYRNILGEVLKEMTSMSQVFVVTFRPEFLEIGDHFYQVERCGRTSRVHRINKKQALNHLNSHKQK